MTPVLGIIASANQSGRTTAVGNYFALATIQLSATTASITFSGIPSDYQHLEIRSMLRTTGSNNGGTGSTLNFNADTNLANYTYHRLLGNGSSISTYGQASGDYPIFTVAGGSLSNSFGSAIVRIPDYASAVKFKTAAVRNAVDFNNTSPSAVVGHYSQTWRNTAPITTITIIPASESLATNSIITLFGVK
jgi:hypothetical protein